MYLILKMIGKHDKHGSIACVLHGYRVLYNKSKLIYIEKRNADAEKLLEEFY